MCLDIIVRLFYHFFPYCELSHFSPFIYKRLERLVSATPRYSFCTDYYENVHAFSSWYDDLPVVWM